MNATGPPPRSTIRVSAVSVTLDRRTVLDDVSLDLRPGMSTAVIGPNGSGKTTLLNVVAGMIEPAAGTVAVGADHVVAYVLQHRRTGAWLPLTAGEVVTMGRYRRRGMLAPLRRHDRAAVVAAAERMEITPFLSRQFGELSGGQAQRVLLAQALAQEPTVLLLDEPITGLDLASQQRILDLVDEETAARTIVVITTHNLDEARHCDQVALLATHLVAAGPPDEVLEAERLREAFGERVLGDHRGHAHAGELLVVDDHGHP